ncbi:MAG: N-acetyltransferase [Clostridia bacterium]|nr:N-acetyltransferase [Clostridia bacterium]
MSRASIRPAAPEDAESLLGIYAYYVEHTAISFEYEVPSPEEFRSRIVHTLEQYPYLVLEEDGVIRGYAYAGPFKGRAAYRFSCEMSIYLDPAAKGRGYGRLLYEALEAELGKRGILNLYACIGDPIVEDETLTRNSEQFHRHMGYTKVGEFHRCGYKFGRWYNMIWMEKMIGEHT